MLDQPSLRLATIGLLASSLALLVTSDSAAVPVLDPANATFQINLPEYDLFSTTLYAMRADGSRFVQDHGFCGSGACEPVLVVEAGGEYTFGFDAEITNDVYFGNDNEGFDPQCGLHSCDLVRWEISIERTDPIEVGPNVVFNYTPEMGSSAYQDVVGEVDVVGARLRRLELWVTRDLVGPGDVPTEHQTVYFEEINDIDDSDHEAERIGLLPAGSPYDFIERFSIPMFDSGEAIIVGYAHLEVDLDDGPPIQLTRVLPQQPVPWGSDATWEVIIDETVLEEPGSIAGEISSDVVTGLTPLDATYHFLNAYGQAGTSTAGLSRSAFALGAPGGSPYTLSNLVPGNWDVYAESYFSNPGAFIRRPAREIPVSPGNATGAFFGTEARDPEGVLGAIDVPFEVTGFYGANSSDLNYIRAYADGWELNTGAVARATAVGGMATIPVTRPGEWLVNRYSAQFGNAAGLNVIITGDDSDGSSVSLASETTGTLSVDPFTIDTTRTAITFDVPGVDYLRDARVYGTNVLDPENSPAFVRTFQAYAPPGLSPRPRVDIVAEPGTYLVDAAVTTQGDEPSELIEWSSFVLVVPPALSPDDEGLVEFPVASFQFPPNIEGGSVSVTSSPIGPALPQGHRDYQFNGGGAGTTYFEVFSTVTFSDPGAENFVRVCISYDPDDLTVNPNELHILHYVEGGPGGCPEAIGNSWTGSASEETGGWCDLGGEANGDEICGWTNSFSPFTIVVEIDADGDGVDVSDDNCPNVANPMQADDDDDGIGNACDDDIDGDGVEDGSDNCPTEFNPDQANKDGDDEGNACDDDDDNDGILDGDDNCPLHPNPGQNDFDGDGIGDACESLTR